MTFDPHVNLTVATVVVPPTPSLSGTTLQVEAGEGILFPDPLVSGAYNCTLYPLGQTPTHANAEVVRVTARSVDAFTITRAQELSTAKPIAASYQLALTITSKTLRDIETALPFFNVVRYGALGDGVTDDSAHIQAAIDAAYAAGGGIVFLPAGTYILGAALVPKTRVLMIGAGRLAVLKIKNATDINAIDIGATNPDNVVLADFAIDCNKANNGSGSNGHGIRGDFSVSTFRALTIFDCKQDAFHSLAMSTSLMNRYVDNFLEADGIVMNVSSADAWIVRNYIHCTSNAGMGAQLVGYPWNVVDNHFEGGLYNLYGFQPFVRCTGNVMEFSRREAIRLEKPSYDLTDGYTNWTITKNNFAKTSQDGAGVAPYINLIGYSAAQRIGDITIADNTFAFLSVKPSYAVQVDKGVGISISGNVWRGQYNGAAAINLLNSAGADTIDVSGNGGDNTVTGTTQWHEVGAAGEPAFANSWVNYNAATHQTAGYRKLPDGRVQLKGLIKSGTLTAAAFVLPAGYRPALIIHHASTSNGAFGELYIDSAGNVVPQAGSNVYFDLNSIVFQPGI